MAQELLADPKERAEHVMLVDLGRNDLGRVSEYGSVQVGDFMAIENYSHVMHIVSSVTGQMRDGVGALDALRSVLPAGTRPRGGDEKEDLRLETELAEDPKERAEHIMLVDLGRNDLGRVSEYGSVHVDKLMSVERYSHVMHLVSAVSGRLRDGVGAMDALRATLPAGTLSGAPKVRAMQIIDELEPVKRGGYGGAVGYLSYAGDLDTAIHIRTVVVKDGVAHVQAGGGTVADAKPEYEYEESVAKSRAVMQAIELACEQVDWS